MKGLRSISVSRAVADVNNYDLMSTKTAAHRLGISHQTLEKWRSQNRGPQFVRLENKTVRYRQSDIDAFIRGEK